MESKCGGCSRHFPLVKFFRITGWPLNKPSNACTTKKNTFFFSFPEEKKDPKEWWFDVGWIWTTEVWKCFQGWWRGVRNPNQLNFEWLEKSVGWEQSKSKRTLRLTGEYFARHTWSRWNKVSILSPIWPPSMMTHHCPDKHLAKSICQTRTLWRCKTWEFIGDIGFWSPRPFTDRRKKESQAWYKITPGLDQTLWDVKDSKWPDVPTQTSRSLPYLDSDNKLGYQVPIKWPSRLNS